MGWTHVLCCSRRPWHRGGPVWAGTAAVACRPGAFVGDGAPSETRSAVTRQFASWLRQAWDVVRSSGAAEPATATGERGEAVMPPAGTAESGMPASRPDARPDMSPPGGVRPAVAGPARPGPKTAAKTPAEPSWGRGLAPTLSLLVSP